MTILPEASMTWSPSPSSTTCPPKWTSSASLMVSTVPPVIMILLMPVLLCPCCSVSAAWVGAPGSVLVVDSRDHTLQGLVGLVQHGGLVHGGELAAAHEDLAVHDRGVHRAAIGREDEVGIHVGRVAGEQRGEHRVACVDQDDVRLPAR